MWPAVFGVLQGDGVRGMTQGEWQWQKGVGKGKVREDFSVAKSLASTLSVYSKGFKSRNFFFLILYASKQRRSIKWQEKVRNEIRPEAN